MTVYKEYLYLFVLIFALSSTNILSQIPNAHTEKYVYNESDLYADNNEDYETEDYYHEPCPDSLVYGNIDAKNYVLFKNNGQVRKLYFDDISLSIHNDDVSFINTPNFKDETKPIANRLSFRLEDGLNYDGENYLRNFGIVAHNIDCFEIPDKIGSIFSEDKVILSNYRELGDEKLVDAEISMIAEKHNQSLKAYFYDILITEKSNDKTKFNATLHIKNESKKINSGKLHYHSNPSPSPMANKGLVIKLESDTLNLFRFGNFKAEAGDYINYQYLYRITEINDENISLKVFSFPADEAKHAIENSFFPDAEDEIMQKFTTPEKLSLVLEIENAPYTRDVELKGYSYNRYRALENNLHDVAYFDDTEKNNVEKVLKPSTLNLKTDYNKRIANNVDRREYKEWTEANSDGYVLTFLYGDIMEENVAESTPMVDCQKIFQNIEKKADESGINLRSPDVNPFEDEKFYDILINEIKAENGGHEIFKGFSSFEEDMRKWQSKYCSDDRRKRMPREPVVRKLQLDKNGNPLIKDLSDDFKEGSAFARFEKDKIILEANNEQQGKETYELEVPEGSIDVMQIGMAVASIEPIAGTEKTINVFHAKFTKSHSSRSSYEWDSSDEQDEEVHVKTITRGHIYPEVSPVILSVRNVNDIETSMSDKITEELIAVDVKVNTNINGLMLMRSIHFSNDDNEFKTVKTYLIDKKNQILALTNPDYGFIFIN